MNTAHHIPPEKAAIELVELQEAIEQAAAILKAAGAGAVYLFGSIVEGPVGRNAIVQGGRTPGGKRR